MFETITSSSFILYVSSTNQVTQFRHNVLLPAFFSTSSANRPIRSKSFLMVWIHFSVGLPGFLFLFQCASDDPVILHSLRMSMPRVTLLRLIIASSASSHVFLFLYLSELSLSIMSYKDLFRLQ